MYQIKSNVVQYFDTGANLNSAKDTQLKLVSSKSNKRLCILTTPAVTVALRVEGTTFPKVSKSSKSVITGFPIENRSEKYFFET